MTPTQNTPSIDCYRCDKCGNASLVLKKVCPKCGSVDIKAVKVEGKGEVIDFTSVYYPPDNYKDIAPYTSILVRLSNGCTLFGVIEGVVEDIPLGSPVTLVKHDEATKGWFFKVG